MKLFSFFLSLKGTRMRHPWLATAGHARASCSCYLSVEVGVEERERGRAAGEVFDGDGANRRSDRKNIRLCSFAFSVVHASSKPIRHM